MVDRGEAATVKEAKQIVGRKSYDTQMQSMIDHGQAASAEEAKRMLAKKGHTAMLQAMVDRGDAATTEEAKQVSGRRLRATMLQGKIDRGEVVTLEEAEKRLISTARAAMLQNIIDRGEAATVEGAKRVKGLQLREALLQSIIDRGEAETMEEADEVQARGRYHLDKHPLTPLCPESKTGPPMLAGVASARANGKYTRYPGVHRLRSGKWQVQFHYKGKVYRAGCSFATEEEAARAHDDYVRLKGFDRPLHFAVGDEASSSVIREWPERKKEK